MEEIAFSAQERDIYNGIEGRARIRFNRFLRAGTVLKNCAFVARAVKSLEADCRVSSLLLPLRRLRSQWVLLLFSRPSLDANRRCLLVS